MPLTNGRYAETGRPPTLRSRAFWLRHNIGVAVGRLRAPRSLGYDLYREWGAWVVRPASGWRSWRWITPPTRATRSIPARDRDSALGWSADELGI